MRWILLAVALALLGVQQSSRRRPTHRRVTPPQAAAAPNVPPALGITSEDRRLAREALIGHYTLLWESERAMTDRLSRRIELLSGAIIALLGFGFFSVDWLYEVPSASLLWQPAWTVWALHGLLVVVVLSFAFALAILQQRHEPESETTETLEIQPADWASPIRGTIVLKLQAAYYELKRRNETVREHLGRAQKLFALGLLLLLVAIVIYLLSSAAQKASPGATDDDRDGRAPNEPASRTVVVLCCA